MRTARFLLLSFWAASVLSVRSQSIGFESAEGFPAGSDIRENDAWAKSDSGAARVSPEKAPAGAQSLEIVASDADRAARRGFPVSPDGVVFIDFSILPVADGSKAPVYTIDASGARLGFLAQSGEGRVVSVSEAVDQKSGGNFVDAGHSFPLGDGNAASRWIRVTIRQDWGAGKWDLFLDGELALTGQPLRETSKGRAALAFYPAPAGSTFLDEVSVGGTNPLFADADRDGLPDAMEAALGSNPRIDDGPSRGSDGLSNLQRFASMTKNLASPAGGRAGAKAVVYIDNREGSDQNTGEFSYRVASRGPRASLRSLAREPGGGADKVVVLIPRETPYFCPDFPPGQAPSLEIHGEGNVKLTTTEPQ